VLGTVWNAHSLAALRVCLKTVRTMPVSANNHKAAAPAVTRADLPGHQSAAALCECGHLYSAHDPISTRYCDATITGGLDRGCVCSVVPGNYPGRM
jgi:hypothetical protein